MGGRIAYANAKENTRMFAGRIGDDTWRVTVYRDGIADMFTTHDSRMDEIVRQFVNDGFTVRFDRPLPGVREVFWEGGQS